MRLASITLVCVLALGAAAAIPAAAEMETDDQKTLYALGFAISQRLGGVSFTETEVQLIREGLSDGILGKQAQVPMEVYGAKIQQMMSDRQAAAANEEKELSVAYAEAQAELEGAERLESGMIYFEVQPGSGDQPDASSTVRVHYRGTLRDGTVFDSSVDRGEPASFALNAVIPCFRDGISKMKVGGKSRFVCPADTAYGERGAGAQIKPGATISFDLELVEIVSAGAAPTSPQQP